MSVAVVIPNRNYGRFLGRSVGSALLQTIRPNEVIVVDGDSTDNSFDVIQGMDPRVTWLPCPARDRGNARNVGIAAASSEFIVPLDADDWIEPTYIERCLKKMTDGIGVVAPALRWPHGGVALTSPPFTIEHFLTGNLLFCCSMFRRQCWEQVGGYDESPDIYEDWDFWLRIVKAGWRIEPLNEPLFHYCSHAESNSARMGSGDHHRYSRRVCEKNQPV
jgi:glycosyltransferase involved in cell wall biosynthesis